MQLGWDIEPKKLAPRVWLKLQDEAKLALQHLELTELAEDDGMDKLFAFLDAQFLSEDYDIELMRLSQPFGI